MPVRRNLLDEARRHGQRRWQELLRELRDARLANGLSQQAVANALGVSRSLLSQWERDRGVPDAATLAAWGAAVGLDVSVRAFPVGPALRDAAQLRYLRRARIRIGEAWSWDTEVRVTPRDSRDHRSIDAVLRREAITIGLEVITRLTDAQAQVRAALRKREDAGLTRVILALADTRHNRAAVAAAQPTLAPGFPASPRRVLHDLRQGVVPPGNGVIFV